MSATPDFISGYQTGYADNKAGNPNLFPVAAPAPIPAPAPSAPLTLLQRWRKQVPIIPGNFVPAGDLTPHLAAAKSGDSINCNPAAPYFFSGNPVGQPGVTLNFNGADLAMNTDAHLMLGAGSIARGFHLLKAKQFIWCAGRGVQVHNFLSEDYAPGANASTWNGVQLRFLDCQLADTDTTPNLDVQTGYIGRTLLPGGQQIYLTSNFNFNNLYFNGSEAEYDLRTEQLDTPGNPRCKKGVATNCTFMYWVPNGKGSTIGVRMGDGILFDGCYIQSNIRVGQQPQTGNPEPNATACCNGVTLRKCKLVGIGVREVGTLLQGITAFVDQCEIWPDKSPIAFALDLANNANKSLLTNNIVHSPGPTFHHFTNLGDSMPGTGTIIDTGPYIVPAPPLPF